MKIVNWTARNGSKVQIKVEAGRFNVITKVNDGPEIEYLLETENLPAPFIKAGCVAKAGTIGIFKEQFDEIMAEYSAPEIEKCDLVYVQNGFGKGIWVSKLEAQEIRGF